MATKSFTVLVVLSVLITAGLTAETKAHNKLGQKIYEKECLTCHQRNGDGVTGMQPPLAGSDVVAGDPDLLIQVLLEGGSVLPEEKRNQYMNVMPFFDDLSDEEIAAVLSYIRQNFGNNASDITADQVYAQR